MTALFKRHREFGWEPAAGAKRFSCEPDPKSEEGDCENSKTRSRKVRSGQLELRGSQSADVFAELCAVTG